MLYQELTIYEVWIEKYVPWNADSVSKSQQDSWKKTAGPVLGVNSWISYHFKITRRKNSSYRLESSVGGVVRHATFPLCGPGSDSI